MVSWTGEWFLNKHLLLNIFIWVPSKYYPSRQLSDPANEAPTVINKISNNGNFFRRLVWVFENWDMFIKVSTFIFSIEKREDKITGKTYHQSNYNHSDNVRELTLSRLPSLPVGWFLFVNPLMLGQNKISLSHVINFYILLKLHRIMITHFFNMKMQSFAFSCFWL